MNGFQLHFAVLFLLEVISGFFALGIGTATVFFALLLLPGVWWIAQRTNRRALRLAEDLAGQIAKLNVELHDAHLPVAEYPHGLRSIAGQVNKLLASFDATLAKERRLSANLAHELATPVAELRALAEVALQSSAETETELAQDALAIAGEMQRTIEFLLTLSRGNSDQQQTCGETTQVSSLVEELCAKLAPKARARNLRWGYSVAAGITAKTNPAMLRSVVANLLENALEYTPACGEVFGRLERTPDGFSFTLANTTANLTADDLQHLFKPLWRKNQSGSQRPHAGLGLALARSLTEVLGLQLYAQLIHPGVLQMTLRQSEYKVAALDKKCSILSAPQAYRPQDNRMHHSTWTGLERNPITEEHNQHDLP